MVSFLGNTFLPSSSVFSVLCSIVGLGRPYSLFLCHYVGLSANAPIGDVSRAVLKDLQRVVVQSRVTGQLLRRLVLNNIRKKTTLKTFQGRRHLEGLPVRGQNTKSNARTARMFRKTKTLVSL